MLISRFYIYNVELKTGFRPYKVGMPVLSHLEIKNLIAIKDNTFTGIYKKFVEL